MYDIEKSYTGNKHPAMRDARKANDERFQANSKKRLIRNVEKKFQTTMIGALAKFEEVFGYLWGHGLDKSELTEKEMGVRDEWDEVRTDILNNGNGQLRAALEEIDEYTMTWNRYKTEFIIKKNNLNK